MTRLPLLGLHIAAALDSRRAVELSVAAEAAGLDSVWLAEDLFFRGAFARAGAIAVATDQIRIGLGVLTPYVRHPALAAMEIAGLAELAPGRVVAGYGAGVRARTERLGRRYEPPVEVVGETLAVLRQLLAGGSVDAGGRSFEARDLALAAPPGSVPVYVAAMGPKALNQAGAVADGVILTLLASDTHIRTAAELVRDGAERVGRPAPPLVLNVAAAIDDDAAVAVDVMRPLFARYLRRWMPIPSLAQLFVESAVMSRPELEALAERLADGRATEADVPEELVRAHAVVGTPEQARARLAGFAQLGVSVASLEPGSDAGAQLRLIDHAGGLTGGADATAGP